MKSTLTQPAPCATTRWSAPAATVAMLAAVCSVKEVELQGGEEGVGPGNDEEQSFCNGGVFDASRVHGKEQRMSARPPGCPPALTGIARV